MWRIFAICFNLVFATTDYECPSAIPTLSAVKRCPGNRTEWIQASNQKKCSFIKQNCSSESDFQYHCLLNQKADGFVEVCLPVRLIVGHFCPFYDSEKARVDNHYTIPCQDHKVNCPQHYRSNEAYKYQECYVGVHGTHIFNSSTANNGEKEEENKALIVQWNTRWSLIFIIIGVFIISIFLIIITVLQLMRKESQQDCRDCWKCCCPTFKEGHIDEKGKGEPYQNGVKKNEREFEQLMENENL